MTRSILTRRAFIGTTAAVSAAVLVSPPGVHAAMPVLRGDGRHDDTDALQALFDGQAVHVVNPDMVAQHERGTVILLNGDFLTRHPISTRSSTNLYVGNCSFRVGAGPAVPYPFLECSN